VETNSFHNSFSCQIPSVSSEELALPSLIRCELSRLHCHGHSFLLSSYLCRIKRKENSSCSACRHHLQDLTHFFLSCPASEPLRRAIFGTTSSIFDLWSRPWGVARLLGLRGVPPRPPSFGRGRVAPPPCFNSVFASDLHLKSHKWWWADLATLCLNQPPGSSYVSDTALFQPRIIVQI